jgi:succinyl-diaminopimelate desuccinylase
MIHTPDVVRLTQDMVRIQSTAPTVPEAACAEYVEEFLRAQGLSFERVPVADGRWNVLARVPGAGGPPLVLLGHMDTVPVGDGWSFNPFGGEVSGGRLFGRGACDMKGGLAALLCVLLRVHASGAPLSGDLVLAATVDEESSMTGAAALVQAGHVPSNSYILAAEPSDGRLLVAQKGIAWYELRARGVSAHASMPNLGADANRALALAVEHAYQGISALHATNPLLGPTTMVVGRMEGGIKTNVVADAARAEIDVRYPPSVGPDDVYKVIAAAAEQATRSVPGVDFSLRPTTTDRWPVVCAADSPLIAAVREAHRAVRGGHEVELAGFSAYTDAAVCAIASGSSHAVVFGPGSLAQAHTVDEFVEVAELRVFEDLLAETARLLLAQ